MLTPLQGTLGHRRAAHLLRRTSFNYTKTKVDQLAAMQVGAALDSILRKYDLKMEQPVYDDPNTNPIENTTWLLPLGQDFPAQDFQLRPWVMGWWVNEALQDRGIAHKMVLFYHQNFAVASTTLSHAMFFDHLRLLYYYSLGNFKTLATKMVTDNVMLAFLNNNENQKNNPNENFAREFFELFSIGKGPELGPGDYTHYTEQDIVEAARLLTGFRTFPRGQFVDPETGIPAGRGFALQHDTGNKTFSSKFQGKVIQGRTTTAGMYDELNEFVGMIFSQKENARHLVRRLYRYFVTRKISNQVESGVIEPLAQDLLDNGYEIAPVLRRLFASVHFYDADDANATDENIGALIKSPLELALQSFSFFGLPIPDPLTQNAQHYLLLWAGGVYGNMLQAGGMPLFQPSDVAGYPAYYQEPDLNRQWFNSSTIVSRYKLPDMLLSGTQGFGANPGRPLGTRLRIAQWVRNSGVVTNPSDALTLVNDLVKYLFPEMPDSERRDHYYLEVLLDGLPPADWTYEWNAYISTNDATEVTIGLERLIKALMNAPEYHLM